jgi:hypothetical protein
MVESLQEFRQETLRRSGRYVWNRTTELLPEGPCGFELSRSTSIKPPALPEVSEIQVGQINLQSVGKIQNVLIFEAVGLRLNLGEHFASNVQPAQLEAQGKFRLRPAARGSQSPNLRPDQIGRKLCPSWFAVCHSSKCDP